MSCMARKKDFYGYPKPSTFSFAVNYGKTWEL
nr:MAG TPA: hypothetical protein [Caudoviricetes sp.]DAY58683.1 MAG TPA: hypothetical protein [Caudoviricetes sp.]DAZ17856.1 MAG TPA: hypothetical protein [Caudoviricetes sp.]